MGSDILSRRKILLLGGTSDANRLARELAKANCEAIYSYAGRTKNPKPQPLSIRYGGFGGIDGLVDYITSNNIRQIIDATHPFATQMQKHAVIAAKRCNIPLIRFDRPAWQAADDDHWIMVDDFDAARTAIGPDPQNVFLAIGRQQVGQFLNDPPAKDRHQWLMRFIDKKDDDPSADNQTVIIGTGPFTIESEIQTLKDHAITCMVTKNAGGDASQAKLMAARQLSIPVIMINRPPKASPLCCYDIDSVMQWIQG